MAAWENQSELSFDYGPSLPDVIDLGDQADEEVVILPTGEEIVILLSVEFPLVVGYLSQSGLPKTENFADSKLFETLENRIPLLNLVKMPATFVI